MSVLILTKPGSAQPKKALVMGSSMKKDTKEIYKGEEDIISNNYRN